MPEKLSDKAKREESVGDYPNRPFQETPIKSEKDSESDFNLKSKESLDNSQTNPLQQFGMNIPYTIPIDRIKDLKGQFPPIMGSPGMVVPPMGMNAPINISEEDIADLKKLQQEMRDKIGTGPYSEAEEEIIAEIAQKMMKKLQKMNLSSTDGETKVE